MAFSGVTGTGMALDMSLANDDTVFRIGNMAGLLVSSGQAS